MSTAGTIPGKLYSSAPAAEVLAGTTVIIQIIEHRSIVISYIAIHGCEHLHRVCKLESSANIHCFVYVLRSFSFTVMHHCAILCQDMTEMKTRSHIR